MKGAAALAEETVWEARSLSGPECELGRDTVTAAALQGSVRAGRRRRQETGTSQNIPGSVPQRGLGKGRRGAQMSGAGGGRGSTASRRGCGLRAPTWLWAQPCESTKFLLLPGVNL